MQVSTAVIFMAGMLEHRARQLLQEVRSGKTGEATTGGTPNERGQDPRTTPSSASKD
jgi:hypothetical protein